MAASTAAQAQNEDGRAQLVWIDGWQAWEKHQIGTGGNWSADAPFNSGYHLNGGQPIAISRNIAGLLHVTAFNSVGQRVYCTQIAQNGAFGSWALFP